MGSSETSVVSRVVGLVAARLPAIKLPTETRRADATGEGRGDAAIFDIELGVAYLGLGVVDRGLRAALLGSALVDGLGRSETGAQERLGATELDAGEREARRRGLQLRGRFGKLDLVGAGIDHEEEIALMDDLPILEMDLGKRASDLRTQFDAVDRRELAEHADPRVDVACERLAHRHLRGWHLRRGSLTASAIGESNPKECRERYH